jgi:hypothetical protein
MTFAAKLFGNAGRGALAALAACAAFGLAAAPAAAGNEFKNAFEDQLGRLLAVEVFHAGHVILGHPPYAYAWVPRHAPAPRHAHWRGHRRHRHAEPCGWKGHGKGWRGDERHDGRRHHRD